MKNLLITGGTGFFGRALLRHIDLVKRTNDYLPFDQIMVMSRSPQIFHLKYPALANLSWLNWHKGDVLMPSTLPQNGNFHYILHAASDSTHGATVTPLDTYRQIVEGTENMLKFASTTGVQRFLFTSSGAAYGPQPEEMKAIPETFNGMPDPLSPLNSYGVAKRQAENLCAIYGQLYGIEAVVARCFAFVGEDLPWNSHFAIGNFIRDAIERPEITVNGNGKPIRTYMYQGELAHWLLTMLQFGKSGNAYNVGSDESISIEEIACLVRDILASGKEVQLKDKNDNYDNDRKFYVPSINKAKKELNLNIKISLEEAIRLSARG
jgi:UDP-glucuronate decarboxylase